MQAVTLLKMVHIGKRVGWLVGWGFTALSAPFGLCRASLWFCDLKKGNI
jgi:hypothetical protein